MAKVVYTAHANVTGGRSEGHGTTDDGALDVQLRPPGSGEEGTNPEQLFAVGYAACFGSALGTVAKRERLEAGDHEIAASVSLVTTEERAYTLQITLDVTLPSITDQEQAVDLVGKTHRVCPYSNVTRGNVAVELTANGQPING